MFQNIWNQRARGRIAQAYHVYAPWTVLLDLSPTGTHAVYIHFCMYVCIYPRNVKSRSLFAFKPRLTYHKLCDSDKDELPQESPKRQTRISSQILEFSCVSNSRNVVINLQYFQKSFLFKFGFKLIQSRGIYMYVICVYCTCNCTP